MKTPQIVIVTGGNTGLGFALVRRLCQQYQDEAVVYLTARDETKGCEAINQLKAEGLNPAFHLLDVTDEQSVKTFADFIQKEHGGVDIVISNAAARISPDTPQSEQVEHFIETNNHGTYRMIQAFRSLLRDNARFIVVASSFGSLRRLNPNLHSQFDVDQLNLEDIEQVMDNYVDLVQENRAVETGWTEWINIPSKIGQVALMKIFARTMSDEAQTRGILINAVCPGLVDTEASRPWFEDMSSAKSPDEAAVDVVWLATLPQATPAPYGELVQYRHLIPWQ